MERIERDLGDGCDDEGIKEKVCDQCEKTSGGFFMDNCPHENREDCPDIQKAPMEREVSV